MSTGFVYPMNGDVCLISRVHTTKPQYVTVVNTISESIEPFLEMVAGYAEKTITRQKQCGQQGTNHPTGSCANKVHWVHCLELIPFPLVVLGMHLYSTWCITVHRVHWIGGWRMSYLPMIRGVASYGEADSADSNDSDRGTEKAELSGTYDTDSKSKSAENTE